MKIRFFNTYEPVTSFFRDLLPFLGSHGFECEVILSEAEYRPVRDRLENTPRHRGVRLRRMPAGKFGELGGRLHKLWIMITYTVGAVIHSLTGGNDCINCFLTQPPLFAVWGYFLKRLRRQPYCCVVMDVYPDVAIKDGLLKAGGLFSRFLKAASRLALREADSVVVIGRCMKEVIRSWGVAPERIHVVTNWANEEVIFPVDPDDNIIRSELGLTQAFIVLYSGNLGVSHCFDDLLEAARRLRHISDLRFVVIGSGSRLKEIERAKEKWQLENVLVLPLQPVERLAHSLSLGDVHFITLRDAFTGLVIPSKAYGSLCAGRPIIYQGSEEGEIARMIGEEGIGVVVPTNAPGELESTILMYYGNRELAVEQGRRARGLALSRYGRAASLNEFKSVLAAFEGKQPESGRIIDDPQPRSAKASRHGSSGEDSPSQCWCDLECGEYEEQQGISSI